MEIVSTPCGHPFVLPASPAWRFHNEGHMDGSVVEEESVLLFAVLAERLPVITCCHNQCSRVLLGALEPRNESPKFVVGVGDFTVIKVIAILRAVGFRRIVRDCGDRTSAATERTAAEASSAVFSSARQLPESHLPQHCGPQGRDL